MLILFSQTLVREIHNPSIDISEYNVMMSIQRFAALAKKFEYFLVSLSLIQELHIHRVTNHFFCFIQF